MKNFRIPTLVFALIAVLISAQFSACVSVDGKNQPQRKQLPTMLERNASIGSDEERMKVSQTYTDLKNAIWADETDMKSHLKLVQLFMLEARATGEHGHYYPAALTVLDDVLGQTAMRDEKFQALALKASVLLSLHQFDKALVVAKEAITINPHNAQIYGALVDAYVELGKYDRAIEAADKMMSIRPDLRSYSRVSYLREIHGDNQGAIEAMEMAVSAGYPGYEESAWCRLNLGNLYEKQGKLKEASAQYDRILYDRPKYPFAIAAKARIAEKNGMIDSAKVYFKQACTIIPEVGFYEELARLNKAEGNMEVCQKITTDVLSMLADDEESGHVMNLEYANVYLELEENVEKAEEYARKEYDARPLNIDVNLMMARIAYAKKDFGAAQEFMQVAMSTHSKQAERALLAGLVNIKLGKVTEGKKLIRKAFATDPYLGGSLAKEAKSLM
ncbi:MAG: tetratricopeptide repeat protein [Bacteroidota bacterium]